MRAIDADKLLRDIEKYHVSDGKFQHLVQIQPTIEPEPCDDPRADVYYLAEKIGIHRLYALVVELRGEPEPCEDAVSREAVSEWLKQYGQDVLHGKYKFSLMYIWKNLMDLPSVQIKRKNGKWIDNSPVTMKCNQCGFVIKDWDWHRFKYCPNCCANMKGEQDD